MLLPLLLLILGLLAFAAICYCAVSKCPDCGAFHTDDEEQRICTLEIKNKKG